MKGTKRIDPDKQLEKRLSDRRREDVETSDGVGKGKRREAGKEKGRLMEEKRSETAPRGTEVSAGGGGHSDTAATASGGADYSTYNDVHSENGENPRPKVEDHYGFLHSISEADRH